MPEVHEPVVVRREVDHLTVVGRLPATAWRPVGGVQIVPGDGAMPFHLTPEQAARLAGALGEVAAELNAVSDARYGAIEGRP